MARFDGYAFLSVCFPRLNPRALCIKPGQCQLGNDFRPQYVYHSMGVR